MTIRVDGVPLSISGSGWANLWHDYMAAGMDSVVLAGLAVTQAGTRTVAVSAGRSVQAGTRAVSDAAFTVPQLPAAVSNPRVDRIVMQVQWPADDSTDTSLTAGTLTRVPGSEGASPVAPGLTNTPGTLMQTPLAQVRVNTNGTIVITDERALASSSTPVAFPGDWSQDGTWPLMVTRSTGGDILLDGRLSKTQTTLTTGTVKSYGVIVPVGFRPSRLAQIICTSGGQGAPLVFHRLDITPDGAATFYVGADIAPGVALRVQNTSWKAAS